MLQSLVITLREGLEAALIVGIVLGYLNKTGRRSWDRVVYWALAAAIAACLALGYFLHRLNITELGDAYEGGLMLVGALFVASMVWWMWVAGKRMRQEIESKLSTLAANAPRTATIGLFSFVFLMVFREGVETVLFLAAVSLRTSSALLAFMGGLVGLALAAGLGYAFFQGSLKVNLRKFFSVTTLVLLVVALQLLVAGVHELSEARLLPSSAREMALVGPVVNNDAFFFVVIVALCLFLVVAQKIRSAGADAGALDHLSAPERRKARAELDRDRFWKMTAAIVGLAIIVFIGADFVDSRAAQAVSPPETLSVVNNQVDIPVRELSDHKLHRFLAMVSGTEVRFIVLLDSSNTVRLGLDACSICGTQGYYHDGSNVICRNCGAAVNPASIGLPGGCNPIHVDYQVQNGSVILGQEALAVGVRVFGR